MYCVLGVQSGSNLICSSYTRHRNMPFRQYRQTIQKSAPTKTLNSKIRYCICYCTSNEQDQVVVAKEGDVVRVKYECKDKDSGEAINVDDSDELTFIVGVAESLQNKLFQSLDVAVRGLSVGDQKILEVSGAEWSPDLLFTIPRDHQEVQRLEGRYRSQGGIKEGQVIQLVNGQMALVVKYTDDSLQLDCNNMMAGKTVEFLLELLEIIHQE